MPGFLLPPLVKSFWRLTYGEGVFVNYNGGVFFGGNLVYKHIIIAPWNMVDRENPTRLIYRRL